MTALASALTTALLDFAWQGVIVAGLLWIVLFALRNRSANARYLAGCVAMLTMAAVPIITTCLVFHPTVAGPPVNATLVVSQAVAAPGESMSWLALIQMVLQTWALPAWSLGVLLFSCRIVWGGYRLATFQRRGTPVPEAVRTAVDRLATRMGLRRAVNIIMSTLVDTPGVAGVIRPIILLPITSMTGLTPQQLEVILAHELAHIRRFDPQINALQILIETLLFYHPAVWWTSARIRHERELCCDDVAIDCCGDALFYARALTTLEKLRGVPAQLALGSTGGSLLYRIRRIMGERPSDYSPSKFFGILAMTLALACLAVNVNTRMQAQPRQSQLRQQSPGVQVDAPGAEVTEPVRYPREAAENSIQGTVVVQADVDAKGNVTDARVLSGPPELRKAVLRPLLTWRFKSDGTATTRQVSAAFQVPPLQELERERKPGIVQSEEMEAARHREAMAKEQEMLLRHLQNEDADQAKQHQAEMSEALARLRKQEQELSLQHSLAGRTLARIEITGLSDELRDQLTGRLPVKLGDILSDEAIEGIRRAIRGVDERLRFEITRLENNQAVLKIAASVGRTYWASADREELRQLNQEITAVEAQLETARKTYTDAHPDIVDFKAKLDALKQRREDADRNELAALDRELTELKVASAGRPETDEMRARLKEIMHLREEFSRRVQEMQAVPSR